MGKFIFHRDALEDIKLLSFEHSVEMLQLGQLFRQLEADPVKFEKIWEDGYGEFRNAQDKFNVLKWRKAQAKGHGLWRLKDLDLERNGKCFRVFYCMHDAHYEQAHVLAVVYKQLNDKSEFDYDDLKSPTAVRMLRAYDGVRGSVS